jgi:hypothetical protein
MLSRHGPRNGMIGSSFGASDYFYTRNDLSVKDADMRLTQQKRLKPILRNGMWVVKKLDFQSTDTVHITANVVGSGTGFLYTSFDNGEGPQLLSLKKVRVGVYSSKFVVPYGVLHKFKIGVAATIPKGYGVELLPRKEKNNVGQHAMMVAQSDPMYETSGLGGLGNVYDITTKPTGGLVESVPLWEGDLANHSYKTHGYQGAKVFDGNAGEGPKFHTDLNRASMCRSAFYTANFDFANDNKFTGWSNVDGLWTTEGIPSGIPLCIVIQNYYYSKERNYANYGKWEYRFKHMSNQQPFNKFFFSMGSILSRLTGQHAVTEGTAGAGDKMAAHSIIVPPNNTAAKPWSSSHFKGNSQSIMPTCGYWNEGIMNDNKIPFLAVSGTTVKANNELAVKVEWFNPFDNTWSEPMAQPPFLGTDVTQSNSMGKIKIVFRFPRQLDPVEDKTINDELITNGIDYSFEKTKKAYPSVDGDGNLYYRLIGRPLGPGGREVRFADTSGIYQGNSWAQVKLCVDYNKSRNEGSFSSTNTVHTIGEPLFVVDSEKLAKANYPELYTIYFAAGEFNAGDTIFALGKCMKMRSRCVISSLGKNDHWQDVVDRYNVYDNNGQIRVREVNDGSLIGTRDADIITPAGIIDADQIDAGDIVNHADLDTVWKKVMGKPLTSEYFTSFKLPDQDPNNPLHYLQKDTQSGDTFSIPYQIIWYKIPMYYTGPYVDYDKIESVAEDGTATTTYKINAPEDKPFAIKSARSDSIYLNTTSPFNQFVTQEFELTDEITQQRDLEAAGFSPEDISQINQADHKPEEVTKAEIAQQTEQHYLDMIGDNVITGEITEPGIKPVDTRGRKYVKSWWDARFKFGKPVDYVWESERQAAGLDGFSTSRDFTIEDVTTKWGANSMGAALPEGSYSTELMPQSNPDPSPDPMLGLGALGYYGESKVDYFVDAVSPDSETENWREVERDTGYLLAAAADTSAEAVKGLWNLSNGRGVKAAENFVNMEGRLVYNNMAEEPVYVTAANIARNAGLATGQHTGKAVMDKGEDLVDWGAGVLGSPPRSIAGFGSVSPGLGASADDIERWGDKTAAFGKGFIGRLLPDSLVAQYAKNPMAWSVGLGALLLLGIPFIGPTIAKTVGQSAPQVAKAIAQTPMAALSGVVAGSKQLGDSVSDALGRKKRGGVATRRLTQRRGSSTRRRRN